MVIMHDCGKIQHIQMHPQLIYLYFTFGCSTILPRNLECVKITVVCTKLRCDQQVLHLVHILYISQVFPIALFKYEHVHATGFNIAVSGNIFRTVAFNQHRERSISKVKYSR